MNLLHLLASAAAGSLNAAAMPGRARGGGARHSITKLSLLINTEIKDILIKDIFPCLPDARAAAAAHIMLKWWQEGGAVAPSEPLIHSRAKLEQSAETHTGPARPRPTDTPATPNYISTTILGGKLHPVN